MTAQVDEQSPLQFDRAFIYLQDGWQIGFLDHVNSDVDVRVKP